MLVIVGFRGNNTVNIMKQYRYSNGIKSTDCCEFVCCRENDRLKEPEDYIPQELIFAITKLNPSKVVLIANGGTTSQQIPIVIWLTKGWEGWQGAVDVIEMDSTTTIYHFHRDKLTEYDKPVGKLNKDEAYSLYHETPW